MQIAENVHALKIPFRVADSMGFKLDRFVYAYLIYGRSITLIDTAVASSERFIFDYLRKTGRHPSEISMVILTHSHPDHIGSLQSIKQTAGCVVAAHPGERDWIEDVEQQERERPVPGFKSLVEGPVKIDILIEDGDILDLGGGARLEVLHTPGHSRGSVSLFLPSEGALFTGDAVPLRGDLPIYDDVPAAVKSIKRLKNIDGIKVLLSSWDDPRTGDQGYRMMDEALIYMQNIHQAVARATGGFVGDSLELCQKVLAELGIPPAAANPLVARSFEANRLVLEREDLLGE